MLTRMIRFAYVWRTRPTRLNVPTNSEGSRLTIRGFGNYKVPQAELIIEDEPAEKQKRILEQTREKFKEIKKIISELNEGVRERTKTTQEKFSDWYKCRDNFMFSHMENVTAASYFPLLTSDQACLQAMAEDDEKSFTAEFDISLYEAILPDQVLWMYQKLIQEDLIDLNLPFMLPPWNPEKETITSEYYIDKVVTMLLRMGVDIANTMENSQLYQLKHQYPLLKRTQKVDHIIAITNLLGLPIKVVVEVKAAGSLEKRTALNHALGQGIEYAKRAAYLNHCIDDTIESAVDRVVLLVTDLRDWHFIEVEPRDSSKGYAGFVYDFTRYESSSYSTFKDISFFYGKYLSALITHILKRN